MCRDQWKKETIWTCRDAGGENHWWLGWITCSQWWPGGNVKTSVETNQDYRRRPQWDDQRSLRIRLVPRQYRRDCDMDPIADKAYSELYYQSQRNLAELEEMSREYQRASANVKAKAMSIAHTPSSCKGSCCRASCACPPIRYAVHTMVSQDTPW